MNHTAQALEVSTISNHEEAQYALEAQVEQAELEAQLDAEYVPAPITTQPVSNEDLPDWLKQESMVDWSGKLFHEDDYSDEAALAVLGY